LKSAGVAPEAINHEFGLFIKKQAAILAMNDAFLLAGYLFAGLAGLIWLAPPAYPSAHPGRRKEIEDIQAEQLMEEP